MSRGALAKLSREDHLAIGGKGALHPGMPVSGGPDQEDLCNRPSISTESQEEERVPISVRFLKRVGVDEETCYARYLFP
jgi:hypothetical protein